MNKYATKEEIDKFFKEANQIIEKQLMWGKSNTMDKYFTPSIEDIRVGYECEIKDFVGNWIPYKFEPYESPEIRVPHLSKEQIEAEGWTPVSEGNEVQWYRDRGNLALKLYPDLGPQKNTRVIRIWQEMEHGNQLFLGECKDINTFRYITKLLGI
jgi:hypothetical protein